MDKNIFFTYSTDFHLRPTPFIDEAYQVDNKYPGRFLTMRDMYRDNPWWGASVHETPAYFRFFQNTSPWDEDIINGDRPQAYP